MKKVFTCLYIAASIFSVHGQDKAKKIGHYFDINGEIIEDYYDIEYEPKKAFEYTQIIGPNFSPGHYYKLNGEKAIGFIKYIQNTVDFKFKSSLDEKALTIRSADCLGFVIGVDSFSRITYTDIVGKNKMPFKSNFVIVEVLDRVGSLSFYKHINIEAPSSGDDYYVKEDSTKKYQLFPFKSKDFKEMAIKLFGSNQVLAKEINSGEYSQNDLVKILKFFKYNYYADNDKRLFYNSSLNEIRDSSFSTYSYYGKVGVMGDSIYRIAYYNRDDVKVFEGHYTSFTPKRKEGLLTYYYPDGAIRKQLYLADNKLLKSITYHSTSSIHREFSMIDDIKNYISVRDRNGTELLDNSGSGVEKIYDSLNDREITYHYSKNKLVSAHFMDSNQKKIYQYFVGNLKTKQLTNVEKAFKEKTEYPLESIRNNRFGVLLLRCTVDGQGRISNIKVVKGIDPEIDNMVFSLLPYLNATPIFEVGKLNKEIVYQEVIFPIEFSLFGFTNTSLSNSKFWMYGGLTILRSLLKNAF